MYGGKKKISWKRYDLQYNMRQALYCWFNVFPLQGRTSHIVFQAIFLYTFAVSAPYVHIYSLET